jgi:hypothetical protein
MLFSRQLVQRVWNSAVFWTWTLNLLRVGFGVLVLPVLLRKLTEQDIGMHYNFMFLVALPPLLDSAFAVTIAMNVSYAMAGVKDLQSKGIGELREGEGPNYNLLTQLFAATRKIYFGLSLTVLLVVGILGTWQISPEVFATSHPTRTVIAWGILLFAASFELYTGAWVIFLRGMNLVLVTSRIIAGVYTVKLLVAIVLLLSGFGLLSIPVATVLSALLQRFLARRYCSHYLPAEVDRQSRVEVLPIFRRLWPNTWRLVVQFTAGYLAATLILKMCNRRFGLAASGQFGLSYQVIYNICVGMAGAWLYVKWPVISQLRAAHDYEALRKMLWPRVWLQLLTYIGLAGSAILLGPYLLVMLKAHGQMLPRQWLVVLAIYTFLEMHVSIWTTMLMAGNRNPAFWSIVSGHVITVSLAAYLLYVRDLPYQYLPLAPLISGMIFNAWYWPWKAPHVIGTSYLKFMLRRGAAA